MMSSWQASSPVYRKPRAKPPFSERMVIRTSLVVVDYRWKWLAAEKQTPSTHKISELRTEPDAIALYDKLVAQIIAAGWQPVPDWPGKASTFDTTGATAKASTTKAVGAGTASKASSASAASDKPAASSAQLAKGTNTKAKRITLAQLVVRGSATRVTDKDLAPLERKYTMPTDWAELVKKYGARAFANFVRITPPKKILAETKRFVKVWTVDHQPVWKNFAALVPNSARLVMLGASSNGDVFGHSGNRYVVFPRNTDEVIGLADLAQVFGWYFAKLEAAGDRPKRTYAPER
jgi:hypothetical protein